MKYEEEGSSPNGRPRRTGEVVKKTVKHVN